jgi:phenylacetate-CoA ligase
MTTVQETVREMIIRATNSARGRNRYALFDQIRDALYAPKRDIEARAVEALRRLLVHAYETTLAYRRLMDQAGIDPRNITSVADLANLAVTEKSMIRDEPEAYFSSAARYADCQKKSTSGSSGTPLTFYRDFSYVEWGLAGTMRNMSVAGWTPGNAMGIVRGYPKDVSRRHNRWKCYISDSLLLNAFDQTAETMQEWSRMIQARRIRFLYGYPSSLSEYAGHVLRSGVDLRIQAVFVTAEKYFPGEREVIERAFQCKSYDLYGSSEVQNIAFECTKGRLHISSDYVCVEDRPGNAKRAPELIVTSLLNTCMPFIRYALGDHGRLLPDACDCGIHTPLLEVYGGSKYDFLDGPNGMIHGAVLERIFQKIDGVRRYQIVQHSLDSYTILVEADPDADGGEIKRLVAEAAHDALGRIMERQVTIRLEMVPHIAPGPGGKFRFIYREPAADAIGN